MKKLKIIVLVTGIIVAFCAFSSVAQKRQVRPEKTSSARAAYGKTPMNSKPASTVKSKRKGKKVKVVKPGPAKGTTRSDMRSRRRGWSS